MNSQDLDTLLKTLSETTNHAERDRAALALVDLGNPSCLPTLLSAIESPLTEGHRSTLIYACSEFDCSDLIVDFTRIWLRSTDPIDVELIDVFAGMNNIQPEDARTVVNMLRSALADVPLSAQKKAKTQEIINHLETATPANTE